MLTRLDEGKGTRKRSKKEENSREHRRRATGAHADVGAGQSEKLFWAERGHCKYGVFEFVGGDEMVPSYIYSHFNCWSSVLGG
jgi:hypothetical protein